MSVPRCSMPEIGSPPDGTQFTCFTGTKVQILTPEALHARHLWDPWRCLPNSPSASWRMPFSYFSAMPGLSSILASLPKVGMLATFLYIYIHTHTHTHTYTHTHTHIHTHIYIQVHIHISRYLAFSLYMYMYMYMYVGRYSMILEYFYRACWNSMVGFWRWMTK